MKEDTYKQLRGGLAGGLFLGLLMFAVWSFHPDPATVNFLIGIPILLLVAAVSAGITFIINEKLPMFAFLPLGIIGYILTFVFFMLLVQK